MRIPFLTKYVNRKVREALIEAMDRTVPCNVIKHYSDKGLIVDSCTVNAAIDYTHAIIKQICEERYGD